MSSCSGNESVWSPMTTAPAMVCSPSASRTWASPRCASTIARSHSSDQIWLSPRERPSRSASSPLPTVPMIVVCRPASRVTLSGASWTYAWTGSRRAMLRPATRPLATAEFQSTSSWRCPVRASAVSAMSPAAKMSGSPARRYSSTRMPRSQGSPAARASSMRGRTPTATATRSQGITSPSPVSTAATRPPRPRMAARSVNVWISTPSRRSACSTMRDSDSESTLLQ